jgi:hypothetical protein
MTQDNCSVCGYEYSKSVHYGCPNCAAARVENICGGAPRKAAKPQQNSSRLLELAAALQKHEVSPK